MEDVACIDLGFGWLNAISKDRELRVPAVLGEGRQLFDSLSGKRKGLSVWWADRELFVGDLAIQQSDTKYFSLKEEKASTFASEALLLAALGYLAQGEADYSLITGLPVDFYFKQRDGLDSMIQRHTRETIQMNIDGRSISSKVRISRHKTYPQPLMALMSVLLNISGELIEKELAKKTILVCDWGTYTLNLLAVSAMEIIQPLSKTLPLGLAAAYKALASSLGGVPIFEVDHRLARGKVPGSEAALKALAEQSNLEIEGLNYDFDLYLITGGGGARLAPYILPNRNTLLAPDPQNAVARGGRNLGVRLWCKRS